RGVVILLILALALVSASLVSAAASIQAYTNEPVYSAGTSGYLNVKVTNSGPDAMLDGYLVVAFLSLEPRANQFSEEVYRGVHLRVGEAGDYRVNLSIPGSAPAGVYRAEIYLKDGRSAVVGWPWSYISPAIVYFRVNSSASAPQVSISRNSTVVCGVLSGVDGCYPSQFGPTVQAGFIVKSRVAVSSASARQLIIDMDVYEWDDTLGEKPVYSISKPVSVSEGISEFPVDFAAPSKPTAYVVRIGVFDGAELLSLYRNRLVVAGSGARIVELSADRPAYKAGETANLKAVFVGPADGISNVSGRLSLKFLNKGGKVLAESGKDFSFGRVAHDITGANADANMDDAVLTFNVKEALGEFSVVAEAVSEGMVIDSYTIASKSSSFAPLIASASLVFSSDQSFKESKDSFVEGTPVYVLLKISDENGKLVYGVPATGYYTNGPSNVGPIDLSTVQELRLEAGSYNFTAEYPGGRVSKVINATPFQFRKPGFNFLGLWPYLAGLLVAALTAFIGARLLSRRPPAIPAKVQSRKKRVR
ncbi:MAG: hypothetical protein HY544_05370, partial [Candidatus Diapherotrites archaeon]|nr:hypothetical protein [Candidatus Diapherotrites archaeon]